MKVCRALPFLLIFLLIFLLSDFLLTAQQEDEIDWIHEIDLLGKELTERHPNLFFKTDSITFFRELKKIAQGATGESVFNISIKLQQVLARMGDAHTQINYHFNVDNQYILPIDCYWFEDGLYILKAPVEFEKMVGRKIAFINKVPVEQVIDSLATLVVHDNPSLIKNLVPRMITWTQLLEYFGFVDHQNLELTVKDQKGNMEKCFITLPLEEGEMITVRPDSIPFGFRDQKAYFRDHYFAGENLYFIQYNRCWSREVEEESGSGASALFMPSFKKFEKQVYRVLRKKQIDKLVFDIRFNAGGNSMQGTDFIEKLCKMKLKGEGAVFVIVGRKTFSSAIINAVDFIKNSQAVIVGEESGGRPNHFGEVKRFVLPESKLVVNYSTKYFTLLDEDLPSIAPSLMAPISFEQYMRGIDPPLQAILLFEDQSPHD